MPQTGLPDICSPMLDKARQKLETSQTLTALQQAGIRNALQTMIENRIGQAKHLLKATGKPVPVAFYVAFASLIRIVKIGAEDLQRWSSAIGIRNRIVHDYINLKIDLILNWDKTQRYQCIVAFVESTD
jgi:uncharacterized protein YutE (UPF0331/DUF86 family)